MFELQICKMAFVFLIRQQSNYDKMNVFAHIKSVAFVQVASLLNVSVNTVSAGWVYDS